jgi:hypothetical protein
MSAKPQAANKLRYFTMPRTEKKTDFVSYFRAFFRSGEIFFWFFWREYGEIGCDSSYNWS